MRKPEFHARGVVGHSRKSLHRASSSLSQEALHPVFFLSFWVILLFSVPRSAPPCFFGFGFEIFDQICPKQSSTLNSDQFAECLQKDKLSPSLEAIASQLFLPKKLTGSESEPDSWTHLPNPAVNVCPGNVAHFTSYQAIDAIVDSNLWKVIKIQNRLFSSPECGLRRGSSWWTTWQRKGGEQPLKSENFLW